MQVVVCRHDEQSLKNKAIQLAARLQWPLLTAVPTAATLVLWVEQTHLAMSLPEKAQFKPLYLDFAEGKQAYRLAHVNQELLVKVCRVKGLDRPVRIIDATAGLGRDALLLAASGAFVTLVEQSPILGCLLEDLLVRLRESAWAFRLAFHPVNAIDYLQTLNVEHWPEVIYLDPMFDHVASKTALVKKDLQMLQAVAAPPSLIEQERLLSVARQRALVKVVVKRARLAEPLAGIKPDYQMLGTHARFDVYQTNVPLTRN